MNSAQQIERDLVRWRRGKWIAVIATVFALQLGMFIWASQKYVRARAVYPQEPKVAFAPAPSVPDRLDRDWLEMENPFLFVSASRMGFSGEAWLRQPKWTAPEPRTRTEPSYLQLSYARTINPPRDAARSFELGQRHRTAAVFPPPEAPPRTRTQVSELRLDGFGGRSLAAPLPLPVQYHSDVLSSSLVEALVDRDGLVISARIIGNSGSAKADADGLGLARRARFTPQKSGENLPEVGKLIFQWFTLSLSHTNNVTR